MRKAFWLLLASAIVAQAGLPNTLVGPAQYITRSGVARFIVGGKTTKAQCLAEYGPATSDTLMTKPRPNTPVEGPRWVKVYKGPPDLAILTIYFDRNSVAMGYAFRGTGMITNDYVR
ncbi:MAG: hypothetical protein ACR2HH_10400 [Chthoniobacterales bacterium]